MLPLFLRHFVPGSFSMVLIMLTLSPFSTLPSVVPPPRELELWIGCFFCSACLFFRRAAFSVFVFPAFAHPNGLHPKVNLVRIFLPICLFFLPIGMC